MRPAVPVSYGVQGQHTSPQFARAFAQGCRGIVSWADRLEPGPAALFAVPERWSLLQSARAAGTDVYYGDHAYYGRGRFYRITKNRDQWQGEGPVDPLRYERAGGPEIRPWRSKRTGQHVVVCPQSAAYCAMQGFDVSAWVNEVTDTIRVHSDREVRVRWKRDERPLAADLVDAWALVTYSSASALYALAAGVPVFVLAPFAAAAPMGCADLRRIERPVYPDGREPFLMALASQQWTLDEMAGGLAWRALQAQTRVAHVA